MHDIKAIRADPDAYDRAWSRRGLEAQTPAILTLDEARRSAQTAVQGVQARRAEASREIGAAKKTGDDAKAASLMAEVEALKGQLAVRSEEETEVARSLQRVLEGLPNLPDSEVPDGVDEHGNQEVRRWGEPLAGPERDHVDLGTALGLMDLDAAARMAGARFTVLEGDLARLQRALGQFMIDMQTQEAGYTEVYVPLLVRDQALYGAGQLPKFADDLFRTTDDRWLIPTSEVPLANLAAGRVLDEETLPRRYAALTPCFRSEAGASGRDTRGMIRQHQFEKVELVSITTPEQSNEEHERMVGCAEAVLKRLELPFRTMLLCAGDMGFSARKTYDLEVWLPSQKTYREISSCSNCGDFQARRMEARSKRARDKGTRFVHTLNGSGLAVGRTLVAIMETYQDEGGAIAIPQALHSYLPGLTRIERRG